MANSSDDDAPLAARHRPNPSTVPNVDSATPRPVASKGPLPQAPRSTQNGRTTLAKRQCEAHLEGAARKKAREKPLDTKTKLPSPGGNASSPIAKPTSPARSGAAGGGGQTPAKQRREKKEYGKIGQTRDTPEEENPLRKFYTSLLEQRPESQMAKRWCVIHGLLSDEEAEAWLKENQPNKLKKSPGGVRAASRMTLNKPRLVKEDEVGKKRKRVEGNSLLDKEKVASQHGPAEPMKPKVAVHVNSKAAQPGKKKIIRRDLSATKGGKNAAGKAPADARVQRIMDKVPEKQKEKLRQHNAEPLRKLAFYDGGLDSSDEDDVPLAKRIAVGKL